ncbi:hypothetical protein ABEB36_014769 [Hypothenemus hampei]|uniref:Uncharacterized protein n=1 Tax=Hypothenemus hampei TaxID=57062 RepID=A0ABD1E338_HYPHA
MNSDLDSDVDSVACGTISNNFKKRKSFGRLSEVMKKLRTASHVTGEDCSCVRHKCFQTVNENERKRIIKEFNVMLSRDEQTQYLSGLITVLPVQRRHNRLPHNEANFNYSSYAYRVRIEIEGVTQDVPVCLKAFISLHGITSRRVQTTRESLANLGHSSRDGRGRHNNHPNKHSAETKSAVISFIQSLKGRKSHYSLKDSAKIYLPEELNIAKIHAMYNEKYSNNQVSYDVFRETFNTKFNIAFGYPRKDTCSTCDTHKVKENNILKMLQESDKDKEDLKQTLVSLNEEIECHKKSDKFYSLKRNIDKIKKKTKTLKQLLWIFNVISQLLIFLLTISIINGN